MANVNRSPADPGMQWVRRPNGQYEQFAIPGYRPPAQTYQPPPLDTLINNNPKLSPKSLGNLTQAYQQAANNKSGSIQPPAPDWLFTGDKPVPVKDLPVVPPVNASNSKNGPAAPGMQWVQQPGGEYKQFAIPGYVGPSGNGQIPGDNFMENYLGDIYDPTAAKKIIEQMAQQGLISAQDAEKMQRQRLGIAETESEDRVRRETETQNQLLNTMFEPQRQQLVENLARTIEAADLTSAAAGSVRGSRQADKVVELNQIADANRAALDAQQQAELRLYQAQLRGAEASELKVYQDAVAIAERDVTDAQSAFAQAQQGVLQSQLDTEEAIVNKKAEDLKSYLTETGQVLDPTTGRLIESLSGKEKQSKIDETVANSILKDAQGVEAKANAAKLLDAITRGNYVSNSFSDEFGNTSIQVFNADTGASEIINVGKIGKPAAELLQALYGKAVGGGGSGSKSGSSSMTGLAASLLEQGITSQQVALMGADAVPGLGKLPQDQYLRLIDDMRAGEVVVHQAINAGKVKDVQKAGGVYNFITDKLKAPPLTPKEAGFKSAAEQMAAFVGGGYKGNGLF